VHNTKQLGCGRRLEKFAEITTRLTAMVDRFTSMLDCVDIGFLPDGVLDQLPAPSHVAGNRIGGIDMNIPRVRGALAAVLALAVAPQGFTVAQFTAQVRAMAVADPAVDLAQDLLSRAGRVDAARVAGGDLGLGDATVAVKPADSERERAVVSVLMADRLFKRAPAFRGVKGAREGAGDRVPRVVEDGFCEVLDPGAIRTDGARAGPHQRRCQSPIAARYQRR